MAENSSIEWCDSTFNPWIGCTKVSPGCDHCYAERDFDKRRHVVVWGTGQARHRTARLTWRKPLQWQTNAAAFQAQHGRRQRVFCASLADVFDNEVPDTWLLDLLDLIKTAPDLDWLLLTKRIGNWRMRMKECLAMASIAPGRRIWPGLAEWIADWLGGKVPTQVWIGATFVNQAEVDRDLPKLQDVPARVIFGSFEPLLGSVDLGLDVPMLAGPQARHIDWVIVGGESGPKARPMHPDWARSLRDQCAAAGVPFLFKQWGGWTEQDDSGLPSVRQVLEGDPEFHIEAAKCDAFMAADGELIASMDDARDAVGYRGLVRSGKKAAGRLLDGRTHDEVPSP